MIRDTFFIILIIFLSLEISSKVHSLCDKISDLTPIFLFRAEKCKFIILLVRLNLKNIVYMYFTISALGRLEVLTLHSPLFMRFWIHNFSNSPVYTFSKLFYAKIMYFYMELLKAINAILLPL